MAATKTADEEIPQTAAELASLLPLRLRAKPLIAQSQRPSDLLARLIEEKQWVDAIRVIPFVLGGRKAVWWACLCCEHSLQSQSTANAADSAALAAAVDWVVLPLASHQQAAKAAAQKCVHNSATRSAAMAAATAGHADRAEGPLVPYQTIQALKTASASAFLAARVAGRSQTQTMMELVKLGLDVSNGDSHWFSVAERWPK